MPTRSAVIFPKDLSVLKQLGENIELAMKRRKITQTKLSERTRLSMPTLRNIIRGEPSVSIGHYVVVLSALGLSESLSTVAQDDELGRKLQDIELLKKSSKKVTRQNEETNEQAALINPTNPTSRDI